MSAKKPIPLGTRFTRLVVIADAGSNGRICLSRCRCDCGNEITVPNNHLRQVKTKSCGCIKELNNLRHGHTRYGVSTRTYYAWQRMINRCVNPHDKEFRNYGGRGIAVCDRWLNSFENFLADMDVCPDGLMIDRINNDGGYCPSNVRWATAKQQARNKRNNHVMTVRGKTACVAELCEHFGVRYPLVRKRLHKGWSPEEAFFAPLDLTRQPWRTA